MEDIVGNAKQSPAVHIPKLLPSGENFLAWRGAAFQLAQSLYPTNDDGLLFKLINDAPTYQKFARIKDEDGVAVQLPKGYLPPKGDVLNGHSSAGTVAVSKAKDQDRREFIALTNFLDRELNTSLPSIFLDRWADEDGIPTKKLADLIDAVQKLVANPSPRDQQELFSKLQSTQLAGISTQAVDSYTAEHVRLHAQLTLGCGVPLPQWLAVLCFTAGMSNHPEAIVAAQQYKDRPDSSTIKTQTMVGLAQAVRTQLGNAMSTTGGAGFAGATVAKAEASELAALRRQVEDGRKQVQDMRRMLDARSTFTCDIHGKNSTHNTVDCRTAARRKTGSKL
jgi:hypothetical protein